MSRITIRADERRPLAVLLAFVAAGAVVGGAVALAAPNGNSSTLEVKVFPKELQKKKYKRAKLFTHVATDYAHPGLKPQGGFVSRTQIWYDDDGKISTKGIPVCKKNLANTTMAQAMALCGKAKVGRGTAVATSTQNASIPNCVLVFNGPKKGGKPTVLLHTRVQGTTCGKPKGNNSGALTILLKGVVKPASGDYGDQLDVKNIDTAPLPLKDYRATVGGKNGYIRARCHDKNRTLNSKAKFTYSDGQADTVKYSYKCKRGG
jgi:hypothetical protein